MKTVLVAVDFSDASRKVLDVAGEYARALGAGLVALHVVEPIATYVPVGAAMDVIETAPPPVLDETLAAQRAHLERLAGGGEDVEAVTVVGLAADEIVSLAKERNSALIVLGSHGHGAIYHLFAGSVVTGVLKRSSVPVLVVPVGRRE